MTDDEPDIDYRDNREVGLPPGRREGRSVIPGAGKSAPKRQRRRSMKQEDKIAQEIGGRRVPGSGAVRSKAHSTRGSSGDVDSSTLKVEAKYTDAASFRITQPVVAKIALEAGQAGKDWVIQVDVNGFDDPLPKRFAFLDWETFTSLLARAEGRDE